MISFKFSETKSKELEEKARKLRMNSVADSTRKSREMQWNCYLKACCDFGWNPLPCNANQACLYVTYLSDRLKYSSVVAYYQAVIFYHVCAGLEPIRLANSVLKATMNGIKRLAPTASQGKDPIFPTHLKALSKVVDYYDVLELLVFVASLLMFRSLLRISHIVVSDHTLLRSDVMFTSAGCVLLVRSTKTLKSGEGELKIPINFGKDKAICAVRNLRLLMDIFPRGPSDQLFSAPQLPRLTYSMFSKRFSKLVKKAGLVGDFASHSMRRGGATYMSMLECQVSEIKARGHWASDCVYRYIKPPLSHLAKVDKKVADKC